MRALIVLSATVVCSHFLCLSAFSALNRHGIRPTTSSSSSGSVLKSNNGIINTNNYRNNINWNNYRNNICRCNISRRVCRSNIIESLETAELSLSSRINRGNEKLSLPVAALAALVAAFSLLGSPPSALSDSGSSRPSSLHSVLPSSIAISSISSSISSSSSQSSQSSKVSREVTSKASREGTNGRSSMFTSMVTSKSNSDPEMRWDQSRFLEEQDEGLLVRVSYSSDGKTASGIDSNGIRFIAQLEEEQNGLSLVPLLGVVGIGGFLLSKGSGGKDEVSPTALDGKDEDRSYEFDSLSEGYKGSTAVTPEYLLSCLLSGSYRLPPEASLRTLSPQGRRIQYEGYRKVTPEWIPIQRDTVSTESEPSPFSHQYYADIPRLTFRGGDKGTKGMMRLFKFRLADSVSVPLNEQLSCGVIADAEECLGIAVSNAGGYHSTKDYFKNEKQSISVKKIANIAQSAVEIVEQNDFEKNGGKDRLPVDYLRTMDFSTDNEESWVNINKDGHWNRLHTHGGASWSGVYYIRSNRESLLREYSGRLLLKPTSHPLENGYQLNELERARLLSVPNLDPGSTVDPSVCDYIEITAEEGVMVIMPSYLHHAVVPLSVKGEYKGGERGLRISLAFNFNEIE